MHRLLPLILASTAALAVGPRALEPPSPRDLLRRIATLTDREWASIERGEAMAKVLPTDSREIAIVGTVRIAADRNRLIERYRDVENLKRSAIVLETARFGPVPQASDFTRARFEDHSLDLRACRPGDCPVRLTEADIERFHREVNWRAADWRDRSASVWRDVLAAHAAAYRIRGREGLPVYANKREPLSVASELSVLTKQYRFVADYSPELVAYVQEFGPVAPPGSEQTMYWTKEDFGIRPVLRISHQVIHTVPQRDAVIVITNQVYADHYLDAAVTLTLTVNAGDSDRGHFYMISVNRARTRSLSGVMRSIVRSVVQGRSRDAMRKILTATKTGLERDNSGR